MANTIIPKNSATATAVPTAGQLVQGELAVNVTDKRLFTENSGCTVVELGVNPSSVTTGNLTASGTVTIPDNAISGDKVEGGTINAITINTLTATNGASIQGLTVGRGAGAVATNTAVGASALAANTTGSLSVAIGSSALAANTTADTNTVIGHQAASTQVHHVLSRSGTKDAHDS